MRETWMGVEGLGSVFHFGAVLIPCPVMAFSGAPFSWAFVRVISPHSLLRTIPVLVSHVL